MGATPPCILSAFDDLEVDFRGISYVGGAGTGGGYACDFRVTPTEEGCVLCGERSVTFNNPILTCLDSTLACRCIRRKKMKRSKTK